MDEAMNTYTLVVPTRGDRAALERVAADIAPAATTGTLLLICNSKLGPHQGSWKKIRAAHPDAVWRTCPGGGVSRARNLAMRVSGTDDVVFADDDVVLQEPALERLTRPLASAAAVVTGRVVPANPDDALGELHIECLGLDRGPVTRRYTPADLSRITPTTVWEVGVGAFFAVRRSRLDAAMSPPTFDESLSNGRFCGGAEDSDFFYQTLASGLTLVYDAEAVARHRFPTDWDTVCAKVRQYSRADGSFYAKRAGSLGLSTVVTELAYWSHRVAEQGRAARTGRPHVPLVPLLAEPVDKTVGFLWWKVTAR
jgi:Glycosyltransferase like family 2